MTTSQPSYGSKVAEVKQNARYTLAALGYFNEPITLPYHFLGQNKIWCCITPTAPQPFKWKLIQAIGTPCLVKEFEESFVISQAYKMYINGRVSSTL
jgi:hypothetical protein